MTTEEKLAEDIGEQVQDLVNQNMPFLLEQMTEGKGKASVSITVEKNKGAYKSVIKMRLSKSRQDERDVYTDMPGQQVIPFADWKGSDNE